MLPSGLVGSEDVRRRLGEIAKRVEQSYREQRRVLSFDEYLQLFAANPLRYSRDAARYVRDAFDWFGTQSRDRPWGKNTRYGLFDLPWLDERDRRDALIGQERVQAEVYRALSNFVREGRANRLILLHGPNGSAKSTVAACIQRALEHYSELDEGALYRFHWVFPNQNLVKGSIGFGGGRASPSPHQSYAHLPEEQIDARLFMEVRDHPLFLLPFDLRRDAVRELFAEAGVNEPPPDWLLRGRPSHKARQVLDALMMTSDGDLLEVLRHVQVERYFISRRYRVGAVTVGPQLSVDAGERQITADRSLAALPSALQAVTMYEAFGELIDAAGGVLEFSDLLKRPLDAFKYLQMTAETGEVSLRSQTVSVNAVLVASANEEQLEAFREHHEFASFRGRLELVRCPYLLGWPEEQRIYDAQIAPQIRKHVAPHATAMAAMFAVLTRMRQPQASRYEKPLQALVEDLAAWEKLELYATGATPQRLDDDAAKLLRASIGQIYHESDAYPNYEGSSGASPREMRAVLLDAAQDERFDYLSPFAVLEELDALCERTNEYAWLAVERRPGGYHDHVQFRQMLEKHLLDTLEDEMRVASGLVDEERYAELFERYVVHVSFWSKGEKLRNEVTGQYEDPDGRLMEEVESRLGGADRGEAYRHSVMNRIAAWAIDHPNEPMDNGRVFATELRRMREAVFTERRATVAALCQDVAVLLKDGEGAVEPARRPAALEACRVMRARFGYEDASLADAAVALVRERYADVLA